MHREALLKQLVQYHENTLSREDQKIAERFLDFVQKNPLCFERSLEKGHLTASCLLLNKEETACLFTLHKKLKKWLQLGGHADGETDLLKASIKEAQEESGIQDISPLSKEIFDLDIHIFPQTPFNKKHLHYDVRYLLKATKEVPLILSEESIDLKWIPLKNFEDFSLEPSIMKMREKLNKKRSSLLR